MIRDMIRWRDVVVAAAILALVVGLTYKDIEKKFEVKADPTCKNTAAMLHDRFVEQLSIINNVVPQQVFNCDGKVIQEQVDGIRS